eukprot:3312888-Prorocentrum_lima.AAC.1
MMITSHIKVYLCCLEFPPRLSSVSLIHHSDGVTYLRPSVDQLGSASDHYWKRQMDWNSLATAQLLRMD